MNDKVSYRRKKEIMVGKYKFGDKVRVVKLNVVFPYPTISEQAFRNG